MKPAAQQAQRAAGQPLQPRHRAAQGVQRKIERPPHPADVELLAQPRHRVQHRRRQVRVLVGIEVGRAHAGRPGSAAPAPPVRRTAGSRGAPAPPAVAAPSAAADRRVSSDRPPISTRWQPISSVGVSRARRTASSNASPLAISVVAVRMPRRCASTMPVVDVRREAEIVGVHHQLFPARSKQRQPDASGTSSGLARMSLASDWNSRVAPFSESYSCGFTTSCPSVPCPELILSMVVLNLRDQIVQPLGRAARPSAACRPCPCPRSDRSAAPGSPPAVCCASSYSAGSFSSLPGGALAGLQIGQHGVDALAAASGSPGTARRRRSAC